MNAGPTELTLDSQRASVGTFEFHREGSGYVRIRCGDVDVLIDPEDWARLVAWLSASRSTNLEPFARALALHLLPRELRR